MTSQSIHNYISFFAPQKQKSKMLSAVTPLRFHLFLFLFLFPFLFLCETPLTTKVTNDKEPHLQILILNPQCLPLKPLPYVPELFEYPGLSSASEKHRQKVDHHAQHRRL